MFCLAKSADATIAKTKPFFLKHWWSKAADLLKQNALKAYRLWSENKKPSNGLLYEDMKLHKKLYKMHIIKLKKENCNKISNDLQNNLVKKTSKNFWTCWNKIGGKANRMECKSVNGSTRAGEIANILAEKFSNNCYPNNEAHHKKSKSSLFEKLSKIIPDHTFDELTNSTKVLNIVTKLNKNKSPDINGITAEHICFAPPLCIAIITRLINLMFKFEYVPDFFGQSLTFAIPKGCKTKRKTTSDDYRGISISPLLSKIYEHCLIE